MAHCVFFFPTILPRLRSPVIQKPFQTKTAASAVACVPGTWISGTLPPCLRFFLPETFFGSVPNCRIALWITDRPPSWDGKPRPFYVKSGRGTNGEENERRKCGIFKIRRSESGVCGEMLDCRFGGRHVKNSGWRRRP